MTVISSRAAMAALVLAVTCATLQGCKIISIADETAAEQAKGAGITDRAAQAWTGEGAAYFAKAAKPATEVLPAIRANLDDAGRIYGYRQAAEGAPWTFVVSGSGTVKAKNTQSRAGTLVVTLDGADPATDVTLQIGPVVRGNAVRDGLPFISFKDFENQLDYADMGKALNAEALKAIEGPAAALEAGGKVDFVGVISLSSSSEKVLITPVSLKAGT